MAIIEGPSKRPINQSDRQDVASAVVLSTSANDATSTDGNDTISMNRSAASRIGTAFHAAVDDDAKNACEANVMDDHAESVEVHYMLPRAWMIDFLSYISSGNESHRPGKIDNSTLLESNNSLIIPDDTDVISIADQSKAVESDRAMEEGSMTDGDQSELRRKARREKWAQRQEQEDLIKNNLRENSLKQNLIHGTDYVLVGEGCWILLSSKFGFDVPLPVHSRFISENEREDIGISCKGLVLSIYPNSYEADGSPVAGAFVPLPESGKFEYEANMLGTELISDDEDKLDDLFPQMDQSESNSSKNDSPQILLLPPSTTPRSNGQQLAHVSLGENTQSSCNGSYSLSNDMEFDNNDDRSVPGDQTSRKRKRYGSGLGNLGNTCFMNSTLQCLAHTAPLRQYFISRDYLNDLNRNNPLGTGGELASEFADLLSEMWGTKKTNKSNGGLYGSSKYGYNSYLSNSYGSSSSSSVVYPRNFKYALGKHAEQFVGYDQHDSQELATYLLDALHEDTNRISKKPYVEKPEQGEDETDDEAAMKAWDLHLKRENSRVLESFMGQMKSRVQCPRQSCGRVSTTFDPFMYLSVPIPGASERTLTITYIPMDPSKRAKKIQVTLIKSSNVSGLRKKIVDTLNEICNATEHEHIAANDICLADIWNGEIFSFFDDDDEIEKIRDNDTTYAFHVASVASIQCEKEVGQKDCESEEAQMSNDYQSRLKLDISTTILLNQDVQWHKSMEKYLKQSLGLTTLLNPKRSSHNERIAFHLKISKFLERCYKCSDCAPSLKGLDHDTDPADGNCDLNLKEENEKGEDMFLEKSPAFDVGTDQSELSLEEVCQTSMFKGIRTTQDVAILEFCCHKFYQFTMRQMNENKNKYRDGAEIQVIFKKSVSISSSSFQNDKTFGCPLLLRISPYLTVYKLREMLAKRLSRSLHLQNLESVEKESIKEDKKEETCKYSTESKEKASVNLSPIDKVNIESPALPSAATLKSESGEMTIMRQLPLTYERKSIYSYSKGSSYRKLGSIIRLEDVKVGSRAASFATPDDESEQDTVLDMVGKHGKVYLHWSSVLLENFFDEEEFEKVDDLITKEDNKTTAKVPSVIDCISKYCQMEQLEETEMWYCNRCKEHVRAWKQFHLYRTPPILIVHLKRFHYSATTHRRDKIDSLINFPLTGLDLTGEVMHWNDDEEPIYDCYAVSNHYGGLGGGHYTAYAQNDDGEWCYFDDSRVTTGVSEKEVVSAAAYVLYYRRRGINFSDTSSTTTQTDLSISKVEEMEVEESDLFSTSSQTCSSPIGSVEEETSTEDPGGEDMESLLTSNDDTK